MALYKLESEHATWVNLESDLSVLQDHQPSGEPERKVGRIVLEKTELGQLQFDSEGNYLGYWE